MIRRLLCVLLAACFLASTAWADDLQELEETAFKEAVASVAPSVLRIETFGGLEQVGRLLVGTGPTTGLVVSEDGYVISSAFNFVQKPSSILVTLPSGKRVTAEIVARDQARMLVLLKVNTDEKLSPPKAAPRDKMVVGQWTLAVGRTFDLKVPNVSVGVLSARSRIWGKALQTDAKISPSNYGGPLINIRGEVLGVLVPLSPKQQSEVAGAEWYDSGIGFAVPLVDVLAHLDEMKGGRDLKPGLLGVSLERGDVYSTPAKVAACPAKSPAYEAGLRAGDVITAVNGRPITRQAQLRHALGPHYAGDTLEVTAKRGEEELRVSITLAEKIDPYDRPFLGILPSRESGDEGAGIPVRFVYPDSPAAASGIQTGDVITSFGPEQVGDSGALQDAVARQEPGDKVQVAVSRNGQPMELEVTLAAVPNRVPDELPASRQPKEDVGDRPQVGIIEVKLPEEKNTAFAYVPENYDPAASYGVVAWLEPPNSYDHEALLKRWKTLCSKHDLIVLAPNSADGRRWQRTEVDVVRNMIDDLANRYTVDPSRIVVGGFQSGGSMAYLVGFEHRDLVRGVATACAALPPRVTVPVNDPIERLDLYSAYAPQSPTGKRIKAVLDNIKKLKLPVFVRELGESDRNLNDEEIGELARWVDSIDRI